ncbi:MAG: winged helix-turn-helix domain-containing protein [Nanoarchaeota archaeon]|nr:winged helix-turn-helix domain-containing protein [Nanoarchaeota archaeon]
MADLNERKTPEEIKQRILEALNNKPLNAQEISKAINSNWSTVKNYIDELIGEKKIKEIVFGEKNIIYQKITGDTYYNLPIEEDQRQMLKFIFYNAIKIHKEILGKPIRRTDLAKLTYHINSELKLNLPIVWYIHGPMPLMIIDLQKDYSPGYMPKNSEKIKEHIMNWIKERRREKVRELRVECYQNSKNELYILKEKIYTGLETQKYDLIPDLFFEFLTATLSYDKNFEEIISEFYGIISGANYLKLFDNPQFQNKFLLSFDSLWKYIASKMLIDSLIKLGYPKDEIGILLGQVIETKSHLASENISELREFYLEHLPEKISPPNITEIDKEARKVVDQWLDSEVWRE